MLRGWRARWRYHRPFRSRAAPVVIGGCGRSGTTLLRVMLDTHSRLACGPESELLTRALLPGDRGFAERLQHKFGIDPDPHVGGAHAAFVDRFLSAYAASQGKARWGEKTPQNVRCLAWIFRHFPGARFLHVIRDPRDTVCSLREFPRYQLLGNEIVAKQSRNPFEECVHYWVREVSRGLSFRNDPRVRAVRYEDLVARPEETLRGVLSFLDLPWEDRLLRFHEVRRDVTAFPQNPEAAKPLSRKKLGRWREELTAEELALVERHAGALLADLGYTA